MPLQFAGCDGTSSTTRRILELAKLAAAGQARERIPANTNKEMQQPEQIDRSSPHTHG
jgi:hypothetical protein